MIKRLFEKLKALRLYFVSKNEAVIFCENDFSTCVHQSFDKCILKEKCPSQKIYAMGVDTYDKDALAYCFGRKVDGVFEIMLAKTMRDENEFKQEIENLAKYFNADVFRSGE